MADGMIKVYLNHMIRPFITTASLLLVLITLMSPGVTQADDDYIEARKLQDAGEILSLEQLLKNIRPEFPGKILQIELEYESGKIIYEVEILGDDGVVKEIYINAKTGKVLSIKEDD